MKKSNIFIIVAFILSVFAVQSCSKFLDLKPKNIKVVSTIEDYRDIMGGYMRLLKTPNPSQMKVFGDYFIYPQFDLHEEAGISCGEVGLTKDNSYYYNKNTGEYTAGGKNILNWLRTDLYIWQNYYSFLGPINLVIGGIDDAEGQNENMRNYVKGEALVWRAYSYFKLLQYFSPYNNDQYGIPIYLKPYEDIGNVMPPRETQTKVYEQILSDCNVALALLDMANPNEWNCAYSRDFVNAMMASIYTYKALSAAGASDDWNNAEKHATAAILNRKLDNTTEQIKELFNCSADAMENVVESDEYYFRIIDGNNTQVMNFTEGYYGAGMGDGNINYEYFNIFTDNDIRKAAYFNLELLKNDKYNLANNSSSGGAVLMPFRLAEMFLIKAEAFCRMNKIAEALQVLQPFIESRYIAPRPNAGSNQNEILDFILLERKKEFYMENDFRWLDMKRLGVTMTRTVGGEKYTILPNDFRYCFPVPAEEMKVNKNMVQIPGWENVVL